MMLATPIAPTSSATAPRPRNRVSSAPLASAWAVRASEGRETLTWLGFSGLAWAPSRLSTRGGGGRVVGWCGRRSPRGARRSPGTSRRRGSRPGRPSRSPARRCRRLEDAGDVEPLAARAAGPTQIRIPGRTRSMPSSWAVAAPSTATGSRAVAALRYRPWARLVPADGGQAQGGGVHAEGVGLDRGDERGLVDVDAGDGAGVLHRGDAGQPGDHARRGRRQLGGGAGEGLPVGDGQQVGAERWRSRSAARPGRRRPGQGRRRSRRRRSRCRARTARRAACGCAARCWPGRPGRRDAAGPPTGRPGGRPRPMWWSCQSFLDGAGVGDDVPVEHLDAPPRPGGDRVVVGDDDDRRPGCVEFLEQGQDGRAGGRVEVAGGLVGQHHRRARRRPRGRSRPAAAPRPTAGSAGRRPGARARPGPARRAPAAAARARRTPAYSSPSATLPSTVWCSARKNCWNTNPIRGRPQRGQLPVGHPRRCPGR